MTDHAIARCPRCARMVAVCSRRYVNHKAPDGEFCPLSMQHEPITGLTDTDFVHRAYMAADLAMQVRDGDPATAWDVLTAMPADELQRMAMLALAAMPVEGRKVSEIWDWVALLPVAVEVSA